MGLSYTKQASNEMKALGAKASAAITASAKGMWKVAVRTTPRDTGTAQAGWKLSTSRRSSYVPVKRVQPRPTTPPFNFRITKDKRFYFWNNVTYIEILEEGGKNRTAHNMLRTAKEYFERDVMQRLGRI